MDISTEKITNGGIKVSGFRFYWNQIGRHHRGLLREAMGNPSRTSLSRWLDDPGSMRTEVCDKVLAFLEPHFPGISIKNLMRMPNEPDSAE